MKKHMVPTIRISGGKYRLTQKIGEGSFGDVYAARDVHTNERVAVKITGADGLTSLRWEQKIYSQLSEIGFPKCRYCGVEGDSSVLVLDLLGPNLDHLLAFSGPSFSLKTTLMLADQMALHRTSFVHRDIKPGNFLIGLGKKRSTVYLIDFGLAKRYRIPKKGTHISYKDNKNFTGTVRYASVNAHLGIEQSRRDDLEALSYLLIYLMQGSLPWQGLKANRAETKVEKVMQYKVAIPIKALCKGLPKEFAKIVKYAKELKFEQEPDYHGLRKALKSLYYKHNFHKDTIPFDWTLKYHEMKEQEKEDENLKPEKKEKQHPKTERKYEQPPLTLTIPLNEMKLQNTVEEAKAKVSASVIVRMGTKSECAEIPSEKTDDETISVPNSQKFIIHCKRAICSDTDVLSRVVNFRKKFG